MLGGRFVLLVEDNTIVAMGVEDVLKEAGCIVVGPFGSVGRALAEIDRHPIDAAVVDVDLHGEKAFPVMDLLTSAGIPFVIATGYWRDWLPRRFQASPFLGKPFARDEIIEKLVLILNDHPALAVPA